MQKLNNRFSQVLILGITLGATFGIAPAQAQGGRGTDGAPQVLANCPDDLVAFTETCDPNADVAIPAGANPGLSGDVNFIPLINPGGSVFQGTGQRGTNGEPLVNIDFIPPEDQGFGRMLTVLAGVDSDFRPYLDWAGTIKDLRTTGSNGVLFPSPTNPRIRDFILVNQRPAAGGGNGIVDGRQTEGFAADLVYTTPISISAVGEGSSLGFDWEMQVYKLDSNGNRIEEQREGPGGTTVFANTFVGGFSADFSDLTEIQLRSAIDGAGEELEGYGYSINMTATPIANEVIPEPTTILSSLLLFGGGAFKLRKRNRA